MFLNNEHVIIMEDSINFYNLHDVELLVDAGIQTVHISNSVCWNEIASPTSSKLDFSSLDRKIEKYLETNLKLLLPFYFTMPTWFPDNWYHHKDAVLDHIVPNYRSIAYCIGMDDFLFELLNHYDDIKDRIQFTFAVPATGEFLWDAMLENNFPFPDEVIHKFIIDTQRILAMQHGEIWLYLHNFLGAERNWNNTHLSSLYEALRIAFPSLPFYSVQFAHFMCGNVPTDKTKQYKVLEYSSKFDIRFFVGSEYVEGMETNFDDAVKQGAYGFITCPNLSLHPAKHTHIQPWMVDVIKMTDKRWRDMYGNN